MRRRERFDVAGLRQYRLASIVLLGVVSATLWAVWLGINVYDSVLQPGGAEAFRSVIGNVSVSADQLQEAPEPIVTQKFIFTMLVLFILKTWWFTVMKPCDEWGWLMKKLEDNPPLLPEPDFVDGKWRVDDHLARHRDLIVSERRQAERAEAAKYACLEACAGKTRGRKQ